MKNFLVILGFPLWFPLLVAGFAVIFSIYVVLWALVASLWAVFAAMICASAFGFCSAGVSFAYSMGAPTGIAFIGFGAVVLGIAIFLFYGCVASTKGAAVIPGLAVSSVKNAFNREGRI